LRHGDILTAEDAECAEENRVICQILALMANTGRVSSGIERIEQPEIVNLCYRPCGRGLVRASL